MVPSSASPATATTSSRGNAASRPATAAPNTPIDAVDQRRTTAAATQRRSGSACASRPRQIAAVIAARLSAKAPNGASTSVATPVRVMIFEIGIVVAGGADRRHAGQVLRRHGDDEERQRQARPSARQLNSGAVKTGTVERQLHRRPGCSSPRRGGDGDADREHADDRVARPAGAARPGRRASIASTSRARSAAARKASRPKRASTPASRAPASGIGMLVHHPLEPAGRAGDDDEQRRRR